MVLNTRILNFEVTEQESGGTLEEKCLIARQYGITIGSHTCACAANMVMLGSVVSGLCLYKEEKGPLAFRFLSTLTVIR